MAVHWEHLSSRLTKKKKGFRLPAFTFDCEGIWGRFSIRFSLSSEVLFSLRVVGRSSRFASSRPAKKVEWSGQQAGGRCRTAWLIHLRYSLIEASLKAFRASVPTIIFKKKWKLTSNRSFFLLAWDWMLIMKFITIPSGSRAFTFRSNGTMRDSLVNRLQQGMAFRVWTRGEIFLHR